MMMMMMMMSGILTTSMTLSTLNNGNSHDVMTPGIFSWCDVTYQQCITLQSHVISLAHTDTFIAVAWKPGFQGTKWPPRNLPGGLNMVFWPPRFFSFSNHFGPLNCAKFGQLVLEKLTEIVATRCRISRLKCTKFDFGWGSAPDPAQRAYTALPQTS